ncbi:MAG: hypothetical protein KGQ88_06545 [Chloroflexi bacterium]|nr:hypothetical protein [Chloroflexota bacterium]
MTSVIRIARPIVLAALVGGAVAFGVSQPLPREYKATAQLYVSPLTSAGVEDVALGSRLAQSYVQLASTDVVLGPAMAQVGGTDASAVRSRMDASQPRDNPIVTISYRDNDAERAAAMANAIAASLVARTNELQQHRSDGSIRELDSEIAALQKEMQSQTTRETQLRQQLQAEPSRPDGQFLLAQADQDLQVTKATIAQLSATRDGLKLARARDAGSTSLWQPAVVPPRPDSPRTSLNTLLGALAGATVALLAVTLRGRERIATAPAPRFEPAQLPEL